MKSKQAQLTFTTILEDTFAQYEKRILAYMEANRAKYLDYGEAITPNLDNKSEVFSRVAFAILSANSPFGDTVKALSVVVDRNGKVKAQDIAPYKMVPAKASYLNRAYLQIYSRAFRPLKTPRNWLEYRLQIKETFDGLHYAKASFTLGLLYPTTAQVACVDTWIQKVFLGHTRFRALNLDAYLRVEQKIASYARRYDINTFLAQWLIWDFARGESNSHDIFPQIIKP